MTTEVTKPQVSQPCGVARLMVAVGIMGLDEAWAAVGLEPCPECNTPGQPQEWYPYCSKRCEYRHNKRPMWVEMLCDECGILFPRRTKWVVRAAKIGANHVWCSKECQGLWLGRNHGTATRPNMHRSGPSEYCKRGHLMAETRISYGTKGLTLCGACNRIRKQGYYQRRKLAAKPLPPTPAAAHQGHVMKWEERI